MMFLALIFALLSFTVQANEEVIAPNPMTMGSTEGEWDKPATPEAGEALSPQPSVSQCCGMKDDLKEAFSQLIREQQEARAWYAEMVKVLTQLVQENKEVASGQAEVLKVLRIMRDQQEQQLNHLMNMARHQSLLVENHQALLFQVSRIGSQLQECTKKNLAVPKISLNSTALNQPEVVLTPGIPFNLSCVGQAKVFWKTRLGQNKMSVLSFRQSSARDTGTYRCSYTNQTDLYSEIHIYVKDSDKIFPSPQRSVVVVKEGSNYLLDCLPTSPNTTDFCLRMADGSPVPPEMNYTASSKEGILLRNLKPEHSGDYVCSVNVGAVQRVSTIFQITVIKGLNSPPSVYTEVKEYVRIKGEKLQVTCYTRNQDHSYVISWSHSSKKKLPPAKEFINSSSPVYITSVLTLEVNTSDSGNLTCIAKNAKGENSTTVSLKVVDNPYIHLVPVLRSKAQHPGTAVEILEGDVLNLSVEIDAYPAIKKVWWETPRIQNTSIPEKMIPQIPKSYRDISTLTLSRIKADESGWYILNAKSDRISGSTSFKVHVYLERHVGFPIFTEKPSVVIKWKNGSLTCITSGYPKPRIQWQLYEIRRSTCDSNQSSTVELRAKEFLMEPVKEFKPLVVESVLLQSEITVNRTVQCVAVNAAGKSCDTFNIRDAYINFSVSENGNAKIFKTIVTGASIVTFLLIVLLGVCIQRWKKKPKYEIRWKIIEANDGNNYTYIDPTQLPYNPKWEFPRDRLRFGEVLGAGAFGKVVEATAYGLEKEEQISRVAVKMLKSSAHSEEREALICELKILSHLGSHTNIVNLLGACTQGGPVLLITEYCSHGDLLNFLRRRADLFVNTVLQGQGPLNIYKNLPVQVAPPRQQSVSYEDMQLGHSQRSSSDPLALDMENLLRFSIQVAQGLDFLASKKCIHRDVAARNVLVADSLVAKICDFGLARDIMKDSNYVVRGNARLPVKWMSPESIFECLYTVQSDVWSYGILLWEIFSLGRSPYPDVVVDVRFYEMIKGGYHMSQPDFAPPEMYTIMKMCWSQDPNLRPTYSKIIQLIKKLLPELNDQQPYKNMQRELQQRLMSMDSTSSKTPEDPCVMQDTEHEKLLTQSNNYQLR